MLDYSAAAEKAHSSWLYVSFAQGLANVRQMCGQVVHPTLGVAVQMAFGSHQAPIARRINCAHM